MLVQYAFNIKGCKQDDLFNQFRGVISEEREKKLDKFHFEADRLRSLYAEILLRYGLQKEGMRSEDIQFVHNEYGKPGLKDRKDLYFNLSHSGDWVICAISSKPVGADVEQVKNREMDIAERFFSSYEYKELMKCPKEAQAEYFCKLWTLKESYVKALGMGLSKSFTSFWFEIHGGDIRMYTEENGHNDYYFYVYPLEPGYEAAICTKERYMGKYRPVTMEDLKKALL